MRGTLDTSRSDCSAAWETLRQEFIDRVKAIDAATPWSNTEPRWWLEMMDMQTRMIQQQNAEHDTRHEA
jgi:hypothetical protein